MAKDFKASQIRATQIIASGTTTNKPSLVILSASSAGASDFSGGGFSAAVANAGSDTFVFISGSVGSKGTTKQGVTVFGGDIVISGTAYNASGNSYGNVAGSNTQIQFNDSGTFGASSGLTYDKNLNSLSAGSFSATATGATNYVNGSLNVSGSVLIAGNLEVRGMITGTVLAITSTNLTISDQVVYLASGSVTSNTNGGIAIASGSSTANQALVFGRVADDTWGVGKQDVTGGTAISLTSMTLVPMRSSKYEIGTSSAYVSSSDGNSIVVAAANDISIFAGSAGLVLKSNNGPVAVTGSNVRIGDTSAEFSGQIPPQPGVDSYFFVSGSKGSRGTSVRGVSVFGGDVVSSGTIVSQYLTGSLTKLIDGSSYLRARSGISIATGSNGAVTITNDGTVGDITAVTAGTGLTGGGTSGAVTLSINDSVVATVSGTIFTGNVRAGKYEIGSSTVALTSSDGSSVTFYSGGGGFINIAPGSIGLKLGNTSSPVGVSGSEVRFGNSSAQFGNEIPPQPGVDSYFFVSGSIGSRGTSVRGVSVFGGDTYVSGTAYFRQGLTGSLTKLTDGSSYLVAGTNITITTGSSGAVTIASTGGSPGGSSTQVQFNDGGTFGGSSGLTYDKTTQTLSVGNLIVTGSTTTVSSSNLVISDQVIYFGSGSTTTSTNGGIALTSGSVIAGQALVFGRVAANTWGAGRQDVVGGTVTDLTSMTLVPLRSSKFEVGSSSAYVTSSDGISIIISGSTTVSGTLTALTGLSGSLTNLKDGTSYLIAGSGITITTGSNGAVTITNNGTVGDITSVTAGTGLSGGGTSGAVSLSINDSVVATVSGTTFTGVVKASAGISGSLTKLTDGSSYLIAGNNISITTGTNGSVTVAGTVNKVTGTFNDVASNLSTTGTLAVAGGLGFNYFASNVGSDVNFFVSGSRSSRSTSTAGTSVFGGDLYVSGVAYVSNSLHIGNSTLSEDGDNDLYVSAGRLVFLPSETELDAFQVVTNGAAGLRIISGQGGLGLNSGIGQFTVTSSQVVIGSSLPDTFTTPPVPGTDTFIFISGSLNSKNTSTAGAAVFGGDVVISGTLYGGSPLKVSGGLQLTGTLDVSTNSKISASALSGSLTKLSDGTSYLIAGSNVTITTGSNGAVTIASTGGGSGGGADPAASYVVLNLTGSLANERSLTQGTGISITDLGPSDNVVLSIDNTVVATVSGTTFTGVVKANSGLSGSLTKLTDGSSYLIAGSNVTITTGSNGAVTIASTGGGGGTPGGSDTQVQFNDGGSTFGGDSGLTYSKNTDTLNVTNVAMTATADQVWNLKDNSAGALNISAGSADSKWTFNTGDGNERLGFWDNVKAAFGDINDPDLTIYHDGTDSLIKNKTGNLILSGVNGLQVTGSLNMATGYDVTLKSGYIKNNDRDASTIGFASEGVIQINARTTDVANIGIVQIAKDYTPYLIFSQSLKSSEPVAMQKVDSNASFGFTTNTGDILTKIGSDTFFFVSGSVGSKDVGTGTSKGTAVFGGDLMLSGSTYVASGSSILPVVDRGSNLGSASKRWDNVYTGDLHLRNDRGDWTIVEEEDYLCVVNNKTGKKFKMALIPLEE